MESSNSTRKTKCGFCKERRKFLGLTVKSVSALALSGSAFTLLSACGKQSSPSGTTTAGTGIPNSANNIYDFSFSQYSQLQTAGGSIHVSVAATSGTQDLYVTRVSSSEAVAVSTVCTHAGCQIGAYDSSNQDYSCACHGSIFSSTGSVVQGPASQALNSYSGTISGSGISFTIS